MVLIFLHTFVQVWLDMSNKLWKLRDDYVKLKWFGGTESVFDICVHDVW